MLVLQTIVLIILIAFFWIIFSQAAVSQKEIDGSCWFLASLELPKKVKKWLYFFIGCVQVYQICAKWSYNYEFQDFLKVSLNIILKPVFAFNRKGNYSRAAFINVWKANLQKMVKNFKKPSILESFQLEVRANPLKISKEGFTIWENEACIANYVMLDNEQIWETIYWSIYFDVLLWEKQIFEK